MSLREYIRRFPLVHKPISLFFYFFVYPFCNGYYLFMIRYFFCIRNSEVKALQQYGFINVRPFKSRTWRLGLEKDRAYRRYYLCCYKGEKCFIKVAQNDSTIGNEIFVAEKLIGRDVPFIPKIISFDKNFDKDKQMLATSFVKGLHPISRESVYNDVETVSGNKLIEYCAQMLNILQSLEALQLVHADIHKGNLVLDDRDRLILLDFGISKFLNVDNNVQYGCRPGTFFKDTACGRVYDDAYSFIKLIGRYDSCKEIVDSLAYKAICERIGKVTFTVKV